MAVPVAWKLSTTEEQHQDKCKPSTDGAQTRQQRIWRMSGLVSTQQISVCCGACDISDDV